MGVGNESLKDMGTFFYRVTKHFIDYLLSTHLLNVLLAGGLIL